MTVMAEAVYATLLMNDAYLPGAMVLGHSLKDKGAKAKLVVLATLDTLSADTITELKTIFDDIISIKQISNQTPANLYVMDRPDLISTFTKIELWKQTQYRQIVYIDSDVVAIRAPNELLSLDTDFAAAPDIGWPDCFNSGVMVLKPNMGDYYSLLALAQRGISFDGADQGLLNMHFREWERLSFTYNCTPNSSYQYVPAYRHFQSSISLIHFIGRNKPWTMGRDNKHSSGVYGELSGRWWATYDKHYRGRNSTHAGQIPSRIVQSLVAGEPLPTIQPISSLTKPSNGHTEQPLGDQPNPIKETHQEDFKPLSNVVQRRFSATYAEWDPSRAPPPTNSKPEASNFPNETYVMSAETKLFTPPTKYPDPPKDMYYEVPEKARISPRQKSLFPWESHARKPTRVFPTEEPPPPIPQPEPVATTPKESPPIGQEQSTPPTGSDWQSYSRGNRNAWDDMPEIERYVQAFAQHRRGPVQVLHQTPTSGEIQNILSPIGDKPRRPSMKLTDFPTEIERPSLPVTPAPIRRPSFWGEERDELGELPAAKGVPKQEEWDPSAKLAELQRRQSEVLQTGPQLQPNDLPTRKMPESKDAAAAAAASDKATSAPPLPKPILRKPHFELGTASDATNEGTADVAPEVTTTA